MGTGEMSDPLPSLPPGFKLDAPALPPLPPGFTLSASTPEQPSTWDGLQRQLGLTARAGLQGLSSPLAIVGDAANGVANLGIRGVNAVAGTEIPELETYGQYTDRALDKVLPKPEGTGEQVANIGAQMMSGAGAMAGVAKVGEMAGTKLLAPLGESVIAKAINSVGSKPKIPSTPEIKAASQAAYKASEEAGLIIKPTRMQQLSEAVKTKLADYAFDPEDQPMIARALARLDKAGAENITLKGVDAIRKKLVNVMQDGNNTERMMARKILGYIDDSMTSLTPDDVVQGNTDEAVKVLTEARSLWKVQAKSQLIDDLVVQAQDQAARTNSGGNLQNILRQKLGTILSKPKLARMFSKEEIDAIRQIVRGTASQNALRTVGRLAPSSNAQLGPILTQMGLMGGAGYTGAGLTGAAVGVGVPAVGAIAKAGGTALTKGAINRLSTQVRSSAIPRAPQQAPQFDPQQMLIQALMQGTRPQLPNAYADALLRSGGVSVPATGSQETGPRTRP
jgi:hypothetical protein